VQALGHLVGEAHLGIDEPGRGETLEVLPARQRTGDASDEGPPLGAVRRRQVVLGHHVGDPDPASGPQHPEHLGEHRRLVGGQVDHAVRDDHVDRTVGQGHVLDEPLDELHVAHAGPRGVRPGEVEHLVGHVQAVGEPGVPHPACREQHVDAAPGAEIEHLLPRLELGHHHRVAAAETRRDRLGGQVTPVLTGVQPGTEGRLDLDGAVG